MIRRVRQYWFVLILALFIGPGMGLVSVQAGQMAAVQGGDAGSIAHAECVFCTADGEKFDAAACMLLCANSGVAVVPPFSAVSETPGPRLGGSPVILESSRAGQPDPYPPKT